MNLLDFKQTTGYFTKKRPIVILLFLFSLVCMVVSVQSGAVFIHSFLSAYVPDIGWFWCYLVAGAVDVVLFYLCAQLFSDVFVGLEGQNRYLDLPTALLFCSFLGLSLFMSVKGADVRKHYHSAEIAKDGTTKDVVNKLTASIDTTKTVISANISRDHRKALEAEAEKKALNAGTHSTLLNALEIHNEQTKQEKKSVGELLDFSKTIVIIFQLLLILCCACAEYMKSKRENIGSNSETDSKSRENAPESTDNKGDSKPDSKSPSIGFFGNQEGHILNKTIAFKKEDGSLKYYKHHQLTSMITDAKKKKNKDRERRLVILKNKLRPPVIQPNA